MNTLFDSLKKAVSTDKPADKRLLRHSQEAKILDIIVSNLALSEAGQELIDFAKANDIHFHALRGHSIRGYAPNANNVYVVVPDAVNIELPEITIHFVQALREAIQEFDPNLRRMSMEKGEAMYVHREEQKFEDQLFWQTIVVYELGKLANKTEFIDSFTLMGYYNLINGYEKDLTENS